MANQPQSELLGVADIRLLANRIGLRPTKALGQNFVHDANTIRRIIRIADLAAGRRRARGRARPRIAHPRPARRRGRGWWPSRSTRSRGGIAGDDPAARTRLGQRFDGDRARRPEACHALDPPPTALVANLPYNVAVPVLLHLLELLPSLRHGLVMVQAEVADRLAAPPGSRVYGVPERRSWPGTREADTRRALCHARSSGRCPTSTPAWCGSCGPSRRRCPPESTAPTSSR